MHLRNPHHFRYNFPTLTEALPALKEFVITNTYGSETIDFHNPDAVKALNQALLKHHYNIEFWVIPKGYLCPAIPGRADYIHHLADLLQDEKGRIPRGKKIRVLDIGSGANGIYPLIGHKTFGWCFIGTEIDDLAIENLYKIIEKNSLDQAIEIRKQESKENILKGVLKNDEYFDITLCNPPFFKSAKEAQATNLRKNKNLGSKSEKLKNFGGNSNELWYPGGELKFVSKLIAESSAFSVNAFWFTALISNQTHIKPIQQLLKEINVSKFQVIEMQTGNKTSRFVAWTFLNNKQQKIWKETRWKVD